MVFVSPPTLPQHVFIPDALYSRCLMTSSLDAKKRMKLLRLIRLNVSTYYKLSRSNILSISSKKRFRSNPENYTDEPPLNSLLSLISFFLLSKGVFVPGRGFRSAKESSDLRDFSDISLPLLSYLDCFSFVHSLIL